MQNPRQDLVFLSCCNIIIALYVVGMEIVKKQHHNKARETSLPIYIGLTHAKTRCCDLVEKLQYMN